MAFADSGITYHGQILKPNSQPVEGQFVGFRIRVMDGDTGTCMMYEETHTKDMRNSNGAFAIRIGDGSVSGTLNVSSITYFDEIFRNDKTFNFIAPAGCAATPYTPSIRQGRKLMVDFRESPTDAWEAMPVMDVAYVPFAFNSLVSRQVGDHTSGSLLRVETAGVPSAATALTPANFTELLALLNGSTTQYVKSVGGTAGQVTVSTTSGAATVGLADVATVTAGTYGSATQVPVFTVDAKGRVTSVTNTLITGAGGGITQLTGDVTASGTGSVSATIANDAITTVKIADGNVTGPKLAASAVGSAAIAEGAVTTGKLADGSVATAKMADGSVTAVKLAADSVTSAKIQNGTIIGDDLSATASLNIASVSATANVGAETMSSRLTAFYEQSVNGTDYVGLKAPDNITTGIVVFTLPGADGTAGQVLRTDGSGNLSWVNAAAGAGDFMADGSVPMTGNLRLNGNWLSGDGGNEGVFVDASGNVGIGTNSPTRRLDIRGLVDITNGAGELQFLTLKNNDYSASTTGSGMYFTSGATTGNTFSGIQAFTAGNSAVGDLILNQYGGNIGIGTTAPRSKLNLRNDTTTLSASNFMTFSNRGANVGDNVNSYPIGGMLFDAYRDVRDPSHVAGIWAVRYPSNTGLSSAGDLVFGTDIAGANITTDGVLPTERMRINSSGNVGIGTTAPFTRLDVTGPASVSTADPDYSGSSTPYLQFIVRPPYSASDTQRAGINIMSNQSGNYLGASIVNIPSSGDESSMAFFTNKGFLGQTEKMRISGTGNVGIGTNSPARLLHVHGPMRLTASGTPSTPVAGDIYIDASDSNKLKWYDGTVWQNAGATASGAGSGDFLANGTVPMTGNLRLNGNWLSGDGGNEGVFVDSIGRVGVGTNAPSSNFDVAATSPTLRLSQQTAGSSTISFFDAQATATRWEIYNDGSDSNKLKFWSFGGAQPLTLTADGNVGIGTTNPGTRQLNVTTTANDVGIESNVGTTTGTNYALAGRANGVGATLNQGGFFTASGGTSNYGARIWNVASGAGNYSLYSDSPAQSYFQGNVGIGTISPNSKLSVYNTSNGTAETNAMVANTVSTGGSSSYSRGAYIGNFISDTGTANYTSVNLGLAGEVYTGLMANPDGTSTVTAWDGYANNATGITGFVGNITSGNGVVVVAKGMNATVSNFGSGAIRNAYGLHVSGVEATGTDPGETHNAYGVRIDDVTASGGSTNNAFSLYVNASAPSYFRGRVGVGTLTSNALAVRSSADGIADGIRIEASDHATNGGYLMLNKSSGVGQIASIQSGDNSVYSALSLNPNGGNVGIGTTTPSGRLSIAAGTTTVAPLMLTTGSLLSTPASGAVEFDGSSLYFTDSTNTRRTIATTGGSSVIGAGAGSVTSPSLGFSNDSNTGFYSPAADTIGVSVNGTDIFAFNSLGMVASTTGGAFVKTASGTAAAPTFSFAGDTDTGWYSPSADNLAASTGGQERIRITSTGWIGIGTVGPQDPVHIVTADANAGFSVRGNFTTGETVEASLKANLGSGSYNGITQAGDMGIIFRGTALDNAKGFVIAPWSAASSGSGMRIDASGQVGIGISANDKLTVFSDVNDQGITIQGATGGVTPVIKFADLAGTSFARIGIAGAANELATGAGGGDLILRSEAGRNIHLAANSGNTPTMTVTPTQVGINTTAPSAQLHVNASSAGSLNMFLLSNDGNGSSLIMGSVGGAGNYIQGAAVGDTAIRANTGSLNLGVSPGGTINFSSSTTEWMRINTSGNVGIGANNPITQLQVNSGHVATGLFSAGAVNTNYGTGGIGFNLLRDEVNGVWYSQPDGVNNGASAIYGNIEGHLYFLTSPSTGNSSNSLTDAQAFSAVKMTIEANGEVGIGTTNPTEALEVAGNIKANNLRGNYLTRTLPTTVGDYVEIGSWTISNASHSLDIAISVSDVAFATSKRFILNSIWDGTANVWRRVYPISDAGPYSGQDFALEGKVDQAILSLRIVRTAGTVAGTAKISIQERGDSGMSFTASTSTGTAGAVTAVFPGTGLVMRDSAVGVGTTDPSSLLTIKPMVSGITNMITRLNSGADAAGYWALGIANNAGNDAVTLGHSSSDYTSGGVVPWIGNSNGFLYYPATGDFRIGTGTGSVPVMSFSGAGNVGIGRTSPDVKLHVYGTSAAPNLSAASGIFEVHGSSTQTLAIGADSASPYSMWLQTVRHNPNYDGNSYPLALNPLGGNVGIGTTNPTTSNLEIQTSEAAGLVNRSMFQLNHLYNAGSNGQNFQIIGMSSGGSYDGMNLVTRWGPRMSFGVAISGVSTTPVEQLTLLNGGNVGIGTTAPQTKLQVEGIISPATDNTHTLGSGTYRFTTVYATNGTINTSDRREKKEILDSVLGLDFINQLKPVSYKWNTGVDDEVHFGVIAQDTEKILQQNLPSNTKNSIVTHDPETDRYGVRYTELIAPLIKAVQEIYLLVSGTQKDINQLKQQNQELKEREQEKSRELASVKEKAAKLEKENAAIKAWICKQDPKAPICN